MFGFKGLEIALMIMAAILMGFSKTGIIGASLPAVALMAYTFGAKASTGVMLTMLIVADIMAVYKFGKHSNFKDVIRVLPPAVAGIVTGAIVGNYITNDHQFRLLMGIIVLVCLLTLIYNEFNKKTLQLPQNKLFHIIAGIVSGFSSMLGNAAGPIFSIYMLSLSFEKNKFIGTTAWFFFAVNLIKVPFHVFLWYTISLTTLKYTLVMVPFLIAGTYIGAFIINRINEKHFKALAIIMTAVVAVSLIIT